MKRHVNIEYPKSLFFNESWILFKIFIIIQNFIELNLSKWITFLLSASEKFRANSL